MDLPTCPSDDVDPVSGIQLPLTPRPTPERDEHALQDQQDDNTIVVIPRNPPGTTIGYPDLPERPDSPEPPAEPRQPKRTGKKDPALRHSELFATARSLQMSSVLSLLSVREPVASVKKPTAAPSLKLDIRLDFTAPLQLAHRKSEEL